MNNIIKILYLILFIKKIYLVRLIELIGRSGINIIVRWDTNSTKGSIPEENEAKCSLEKSFLNNNGTIVIENDEFHNNTGIPEAYSNDVANTQDQGDFLHGNQNGINSCNNTAYVWTENMETLFKPNQDNSIMDYVKKAKSISPDANGFLMAKTLPEFENLFYPLIYDFFMKLPKEPIKFKCILKSIKNKIVENISKESEDRILSSFKQNRRKLIPKNKHFDEIFQLNHKNIISRLSEAYVFNLFYYILGPFYYKQYLFCKEKRSFRYVLIESSKISKCYLFPVEAERSQEMFNNFLNNQINQLELTALDLKNYFNSNEYKNQQNQAKILFLIDELFKKNNIANIDYKFVPRTVNLFSIPEQTINLQTIDKSLEFIGIFSNILPCLTSYFCVNIQSFIHRFYNSYLIFLLFTYYPGNKRDELKKLISKIEIYLDLFSPYFLYKINLNAFKFLFGVYEEKLNINFIPAFIKIMKSVIFHIKNLKVDEFGNEIGENYFNNVVKRARWFINKINSVFENEYVKKISNYEEFTKAYYGALRDNSIIDNLNYEKPKPEFTTDCDSTKASDRSIVDSIFKDDCYSIIGNLNYEDPKPELTADCDSTKASDRSRVDSIFKDDCFDNDECNIQFEDILDEFWVRFKNEEKSNPLFDSRVSSTDFPTKKKRTNKHAKDTSRKRKNPNKDSNCTNSSRTNKKSKLARKQ